MVSKLSVIESRWWNNGNDSVRSLFETIGGIIYSNPHSIRYDMFADRTSLEKIIKNVSENDFDSVYIGCHGNDTSIFGIDDNEISRTELRNIFRTLNNKINGLYFGSCSVCSRKNAEFLLDPANFSGLQWVAGYKNDVEWVNSSAIDMMFFSKYLYEKQKNKSRKKGKLTDIQIAINTANQMKTVIPYAFSSYGLNVFYVENSNSISSVW